MPGLLCRNHPNGRQALYALRPKLLAARYPALVEIGNTLVVSRVIGGGSTTVWLIAWIVAKLS